MFIIFFLIMDFKLFSASLVLVIGFVSSCNVPQDPFDPLGPWHQRHLDCGIPPFAYRLPQDAQSKIHAIWIKYEAGDDCEEEAVATQNVILSITDDARHAAFKGMCGPGFLKDEPGNVHDEFYKVWFNDNLNVDEKEAEFKKLATQHLKGKSKANFDKFIQVLDEHKKDRKNTIDAMSPQAQDAYNKWVNMRKEERVFLAGLPAEIRAELGLVCKCCGGCKTGKPTATSTNGSHQHSRAARSTTIDHLEGALQRADAHILHLAAAPECSYY